MNLLTYAQKGLAMKLFRNFLLLFLMLNIPSFAISAELNFKYEPAIVKLRGKLIISKAIDRNEKVVKFDAFKTENPINVIGEDEYSPTVRGVSVMQPVIFDEKLRKVWIEISKQKNNTVEIVGTLFPRDNANQLTDVLFTIKEIKVIDAK